MFCGCFQSIHIIHDNCVQVRGYGGFQTDQGNGCAVGVQCGQVFDVFSGAAVRCIKTGGKQDSVDPLGFQSLYIFFFFFQAAAGAEHINGIAFPVGGVLKAFQKRREEYACDRGHDDCNGVGLSAFQPPCHQIHFIIQFIYRLHDPLLQAGAHHFGTVKYIGNGGNRHIGKLCHIFDSHGFRLFGHD